MQQIDLSHYDLKDTFTAREIACLVVGVDPAGISEDELCASREYPRIVVIRQAVEKAALCARSLYDEATSRAFLPFDCSWSEILGPIPPWRDEGKGATAGALKGLPSVELIQNWTQDDVRINNGQTLEPEFFRTEVQEWFGQTRYAKARYFVSEDALESAHQPAARWP